MHARRNHFELSYYMVGCGGGVGSALLASPLPPPRATYDGDSYLISHQNIQQLPNIQIGPSILYQPEDEGTMLNSIIVNRPNTQRLIRKLE